MNRAYHRQARIKADPELGPGSMFGLEIRFRSLHLLQYRKSRAACLQWCILKCDWSAEDCHDAVAAKALNDTVLLMYGFLHKLRQLAHALS